LKHNLQQNKTSETAARLFLEKGFENVTLPEIAVAAGLREADVYKYFGSKYDVILFLYQRINADWEISAGALKDADLAARFEAAMLEKIELIAPYDRLLGDLIGLLIKNSQLGVNSPRTRHIRLRGIRIMQKLVDGSRGRVLKRVGNLPALLYVVHWAILFLRAKSSE
jgi:AcrR family transcriptional regulator